jgi:hypothetical protein
MNWAILIGIALYFIATAVRDGAGGWDFGRGRSMNFGTTIDGQTFNFRAEGDVDLAPDGSGLIGLDDGGYLDIRRTRDGNQRRVRFTGENGEVVRQYWVGGDEQPWTPEADAFVTEVMPIVLRETTIDASERVAWLLANRGPTGLIDEIGLIQSDYAQRVYSVQYSETATIAPADFARLMALVENNMSSDFEVRITLTAVHGRQEPTGESFIALLNAARGLGSDFETRVLLQTVSESLRRTPEAASAYLDLAAMIGSDFELRNALIPLVVNDELGEDIVGKAIELGAREIGSDFELRMLLAPAASRVGRSDALAQAYTNASKAIDSDFELRQTLMTLAGSAELTPAGWKGLLTTAQQIDGDFECAALLMGVAHRLPQDAEVIAAYRATLETVGSDHERLRAAAVLDNAMR